MNCRHSVALRDFHHLRREPQGTSWDSAQRNSEVGASLISRWSISPMARYRAVSELSVLCVIIHSYCQRPTRIENTQVKQQQHDSHTYFRTDYIIVSVMLWRLWKLEILCLQQDFNPHFLPFWASMLTITLPRFPNSEVSEYCYSKITREVYSFKQGFGKCPISFDGSWSHIRKVLKSKEGNKQKQTVKLYRRWVCRSKPSGHRPQPLGSTSGDTTRMEYSIITASTQRWLIECWSSTSLQHIRSYQDGYRLMTVRTHGDFTAPLGNQVVGTMS